MEKDIYTLSVADRIRKRRQELNMTQEELALKLGYTGRSAITNIEKGRNQLRQTKIKQIADALDTTPEYLMGWIDEEPEQTALEDLDLLRKYHSLTPANQRAVRIMIDSLLQE